MDTVKQQSLTRIGGEIGISYVAAGNVSEHNTLEKQSRCTSKRLSIKLTNDLAILHLGIYQR